MADVSSAKESCRGVLCFVVLSEASWSCCAHVMRTHAHVMWVCGPGLSDSVRERGGVCVVLRVLMHAGVVVWWGPTDMCLAKKLGEMCGGGGLKNDFLGPYLPSWFFLMVVSSDAVGIAHRELPTQALGIRLIKLP